MKPIIKSTYEDFARNTSIHGFQNTIDRSKLSKIIWAMLVLTAVLFSIYISFLVWIRYISNPTLTSIKTMYATISELPFPAITICSNNKIIKQKMEQFIQTLNLNNVTTEDDVKEALPVLILFMNANFAQANTSRDYLWLKELLNDNGYSEFEAFKKISMNCAEMLVKCKWEEREFNCSRLFIESFTDQSRCCSFNLDLKQTKKPIHTKYFGQYMGLKVIANNSNDDHQFGLIRAKGITVALHNNDDYPINAKYRVISSSYITYFQITGTTIEDSEEVQMLPVDQRECVYEHEVKLKYFKGYSDNKCLTECEIKKYIAQCKCVPFNYLFSGEQMCGLEHLQCLLKFNLLKQNFLKSCHCPHQCLDVNYKLLSSGSNLVHSQYSTSSLLDNMTLSDITMVNIYFSNDVFTILQRDIVTGSIYLMSSLGGTFSLFLGCSFTSAFEILYYLSTRFLINLKVFNKIENTGRLIKPRRIVCVPLDKTKKHIHYDNNIFYN